MKIRTASESKIPIAGGAKPAGRQAGGATEKDDVGAIFKSPDRANKSVGAVFKPPGHEKHTNVGAIFKSPDQGVVSRRNLLSSGFTLLELVIVMGLLALVMVVALALFNPFRQIERAWDGQRKSETANLSKIFEDFYNDRSTYPTAADICIDSPVVDGDSCSCTICGRDSSSPSFAPYMSQLPCDPQNPRKTYLYQYQCSAGQWYKIFAQLSTEEAEGYNHGVASPNSSVGPFPTIPAPTNTPVPGAPTATPIPPTSPSHTPTPPVGSPTPTLIPSPTPVYPPCPDDPAPKFCVKNFACNNCGSFGSCELPGSCDSPLQLYSDAAPGCTQACTSP